MCDNSSGPKLQLVFDELYRKTVPCVRINNESLVKVLKLAKEHCLALDGCCSSRVKVSVCDFERILTKPCNEGEQAISAYFQCSENTRGCCDCLDADGHCDDAKCDDNKDDKGGKDNKDDKGNTDNKDGNDNKDDKGDKKDKKDKKDN